MELKDLKVGDPIYMTHRDHGARLTKVKKVGRKYLYVDGYRDDGFDRETGRINDNYGNTYVYTVEAWEKRAAEAAAEAQLRSWGLAVEFGFRGGPARNKLAAIVAAIKPLFEEKTP